MSNFVVVAKLKILLTMKIHAIMMVNAVACWDMLVYNVLLAKVDM